MSDRDFREDLLAALRAHIRTAQPTLDVRVGWVGAEAFPAGDCTVLCLEALDARRELSNAVARAFTTPDDEDSPVSQITIDYGRATVPIVATLYVVTDDQPKSRRGQWIRRIEELFPLEPGRSQALDLVLSNPQATRVRLIYDQSIPRDDAEGVKRNEWRATIRMTASFALTGLRDYPFCRRLFLMDGFPENAIAVDGVIAPED